MVGVAPHSRLFLRSLAKNRYLDSNGHHEIARRASTVLACPRTAKGDTGGLALVARYHCRRNYASWGNPQPPCVGLEDAL